MLLNFTWNQRINTHVFTLNFTWNQRIEMIYIEIYIESEYLLWNLHGIRKKNLHVKFTCMESDILHGNLHAWNQRIFYMEIYMEAEKLSFVSMGPDNRFKWIVS